MSKDKRIIKICDLGTASEIDSPENTITPNLVSRYYRPPEVILGLKYDEQVDLWSAACCLVEMYTGQIIFAGKHNNEMLKLHMELSGKFPKKMLKRGAFTAEYFDEQGYFLCQKEEPGTNKTITKKILITKPSIDILRLLAPNSKIIPEAEVCSKIFYTGSFVVNTLQMADLRLLKDLLQKMFTLDPTKRISVENALTHPFVVGNLNKK